MPTLRLGVADQDMNMPIIDGTVKPDGFKLEITHGTNDGAIHALLRDGVTEVSEYGFSSLLRARDEGAPLVAIPAFPNRKFRIGYIFVNAAAGIQKPKDLEGRRVGIPGWSVTACVWAKGALQDYYGVDLRRIQWLAVRDDGSAPPSGTTLGRLKDRGDLDSMLVSGELDAVIEPNVLPSVQRGDVRVRRLFPDHRAEEQAYFRNTGIFPISHMVTFAQATIDRHPSAPVAFLEAFRRARDVAFQRIEDQQVISISWASALLDEQRALMGDNYWAYNVEANRTALAAMTRFAFEQGLTPTRMSYEDLFHPGAAALPGV